jgi:hypothetical protein
MLRHVAAKIFRKTIPFRAAFAKGLAGLRQQKRNGATSWELAAR